MPRPLTLQMLGLAITGSSIIPSRTQLDLHDKGAARHAAPSWRNLRRVAQQRGADDRPSNAGHKHLWLGQTTEPPAPGYILAVPLIRLLACTVHEQTTCGGQPQASQQEDGVACGADCSEESSAAQDSGRPSTGRCFRQAGSASSHASSISYVSSNESSGGLEQASQAASSPPSTVQGRSKKASADRATVPPPERLHPPPPSSSQPTTR